MKTIISLLEPNIKSYKHNLAYIHMFLKILKPLSKLRSRLINQAE